MGTELIKTRALSNPVRIKARINITSTDHDTLLERLIMGITDHIESLCNRKFAYATYTNEVYNIFNEGQEMLSLDQTPVITLTSLQYRAGTPSTPSWTSFTTDQFELLSNGKSGLVKIYGGTPRGINHLRATYTAGYLIDFDNTTDITKHTLPFDLTDLAERLVIKRFKRREAEGKLTETFEGGTVSWEDLLTGDDKDIINRYTRIPSFV